MSRTAFVLTMLGLAAASGAAHANEAAIRKALEPKMGGGRIEAVSPSPIPGLFEVQYRTAEGVQVLYTDGTATYVIQGNIFDIQAGRDLTKEKTQKLNAVKFEELPLDLAVKVQRGNGKRVVAMFSDPYCPYCQRFEQTLQQFDDMTVYVFMYPIIRPDNAGHSKAVWCSPDRAKAWLELAIHHRPPAAGATCDNPVDKIKQLGTALRIRGTPTVILTNGERYSGALSASDLRAAIDKAAASGSTSKAR